MPYSDRFKKKQDFNSCPQIQCALNTKHYCASWIYEVLTQCFAHPVVSCILVTAFVAYTETELNNHIRKKLLIHVDTASMLGLYDHSLLH